MFSWSGEVQTPNVPATFHDGPECQKLKTAIKIMVRLWNGGDNRTTMRKLLGTLNWN